MCGVWNVKLLLSQLFVVDQMLLVANEEDRRGRNRFISWYCQRFKYLEVTFYVVEEAPQTKKIVYNTIKESIATYASEGWEMNARNTRRYWVEIDIWPDAANGELKMTKEPTVLGGG